MFCCWPGYARSRSNSWGNSPGLFNSLWPKYMVTKMQIKSGSCNGLLPSLLEPMLTNHQWSLKIHLRERARERARERERERERETQTDRQTERQRERLFIGLFGDRGHRGPYSTYSSSRSQWVNWGYFVIKRRKTCVLGIHFLKSTIPRIPTTYFPGWLQADVLGIILLIPRHNRVQAMGFAHLISNTEAGSVENIDQDWNTKTWQTAHTKVFQDFMKTSIAI